jgi:penicillin amidase
MKEVDTNFMDGPSGKDDIRNIWFSKNPSAVNQNGTTCIQQTISLKQLMVLYILVYLPEQRKRNYPVIRAKVNWDKESVGKMITDNTSSVAPMWLRI